MSLACSSSQRRRSSSKRANRSRRASWYDANPPGWVQALLPPPNEPSSTVTIRVAVWSSSSRSWLMNRIVLSESRIRCSSQSLPGTSRKLSGSSSSSTSSGPSRRYSSTSRFCSPPLRVRQRCGTWRGRRAGRGRAPCRRPRRPRGRSRRRRRTPPAPRRSAAGSSRRRSPSARAPTARRRPRPRGPARATTESSRSATVGSSPRSVPTIWRITPRPPVRVTTPAWGTRSPVMMRSSVVLPAPLAPTSATLAPSPTRNDTSSSRTRPSGSS